MKLDAKYCDALIRAALREDGAGHDLTTLATIAPSARSKAKLLAREAGVAAGLAVFARVFEIQDKACRPRLKVKDGQRFRAGAVLAELSGPTRALLSAERVALNILQRLCGIATQTAAFVAGTRGTKARILDTRKTTPLLRPLERYAVSCGGGLNHRYNLSSAILIKDNHIQAAGSAGEAVRLARRAAHRVQVEVECESLAQLRDALAAGPDIILLDNMPVPLLRQALKLIGSRAITEISGGVKVKDVKRYARLGVDHISVGRLTHSVPSLDLSLEFV